MRIALVAAAVLGVGCGHILGIGDFQLADDAPVVADGGVDGRGDAAPDAPPGCYGSGLLGTVCLSPPATAPVTVSGTVDTDASATCTQVVGNVCAITGMKITVSGDVPVIGSRPLALIASDSIRVDGTLDASSSSNTVAMTVGAGANPGTCLIRPGASNSSEAGGGGAGGSNGSQGGNGGDNNKGSALGGIAASPTIPLTVVGGCPGGRGGDGNQNGNGGAGGNGGGAVYLLAGSSIQVGGAVFASGSGGLGSTPSRGAGGGGGSGGLVGLEAPAIMISGIVAANGGGGGGGGDASSGHPGGDGTTTTYSTAALGGAAESSSHGGAGGDGGALGLAAGDGVKPAQCCGGGGGGGGGVGVVWVKGTLSGSQISPAPSLH